MDEDDVREEMEGFSKRVSELKRSHQQTQNHFSVLTIEEIVDTDDDSTAVSTQNQETISSSEKLE